MATEIVINGQKLTGDEIVTIEKMIRTEMKNCAEQLSNPLIKPGMVEWNIFRFRQRNLTSLIEKFESKPVSLSINGK